MRCLINQWIVESERESNTKPDVSRAQKSARLPKFELKRFDGNPLDWHVFWDTFGSTVDKDNNLDDVTKFNYLKSVLDEKAADCVKELMLYYYYLL